MSDFSSLESLTDQVFYLLKFLDMITDIQKRQFEDRDHNYI